MSVVIAGYARTPFVKYCGAFSRMPATALGAHAVAAALDDAGIAPEAVDHVVAGQVLQGGAGQNPARQSAVGAGIPLTVPASTLNVVCLSGTEAVAAGARLIAAGEAQVVVALGQESMTLAPHAYAARMGTRYGQIALLDTLAHDGLSDAFEKRSMGESTEEHGARHGFTREEQDAWAVESHARAVASRELLAGEIAPVTVKEGQDPVAEDDGVRPGTSLESLARLRPAFGASGTITAGNASQISDGAAAVVLADESVAPRAIARIVATALVAGPDVSLHEQPAAATEAALARAGRAVGDLATVEINEAFASVALASMRRLGVDASIVNPHGGAIALGHPIGASGARLVGHAARTLASLGPGALGVAALCGGGGQGSAVLLEAV
ncbi:acetyl-CoA C-acyltransferase [Demequina lignilytica]|uniref:Probable acetyl-CoA acetyltransferase n=1 Tax=Demequina lignilytica TaxID=3051663 RepID=A0AB35MKM8_9MICO|nr:acetyl-CoA C-acyltransferase [Demequina sp. SYSU T0a273]MDN4484282.1 acetyl-CoA C-acyltransferase [Demequina sp. SYSU T0a273]